MPPTTDLTPESAEGSNCIVEEPQVAAAPGVKILVPLALKNPLPLRTRSTNESRVSTLHDQLNLPKQPADLGSTTKLAGISTGLSENVAPMTGLNSVDPPLGTPLFVFSKNSCSPMNLFGQEYCQGRKKVSKQEVKDAFDLLGLEKKAEWAALRLKKLGEKKGSK